MPGDLKKLYSNILSEQRFCPLYCEPWWLDAICGAANWDVYFFKDNHGNAVACLPYYSTRVSGLKAVITPPMTQWLSVLSIKNTFFNIQDLLLHFGSIHILDLTLKSEAEIIYSDAKHAANLKYSFVIDSLNIEDVRSKYNEGLRRNLKEADKNYSLQESDDINTLIRLAISSYEQRNEKAPRWIHDVPHKVFKALQKEKRGRITFAMRDNDPVAGIMTGWDAITGYYLLGGRNETGGASAHAYLLDDAVSHAVTHERKFDFEGSMHPGIANFFQSFGAKPAPYIRICKYKGLGKIWSYLHK